MTLRVKCKCGKGLKIPAKLAGRKLNCPGCQKPFRISPEKFQAATKAHAAQAGKADSAPSKSSVAAARPATSAQATATRSTGSKAAQPKPATEGSDPVPVDLSGEIGLDGVVLLSDFAADAERANSIASPAIPAAVIPIDMPELATVQYARERTPGSATRSGIDNATGPARGFWVDAFRSFIYPVANFSNIITFCIVLVIASLDAFIGGGCLGIIASFIIFGWLAALYLSVIQDTAAGSEDLPGIKMQDGFIEDIVKPAFKYIGAFAVAMLPMILLIILLVAGTLPTSWGFMIPIWGAIGVFVLPMVLLLFAFDALAMVIRLDLIFTTIIRTILPYLGIWLMLVVIGLLMGISVLAPLFEFFGLSDSFPENPLLEIASGLVLNIIVIAVNTYFTIVAMRVIGLYYLHFKRRFTIIME